MTGLDHLISISSSWKVKKNSSRLHAGLWGLSRLPHRPTVCITLLRSILPFSARTKSAISQLILHGFYSAFPSFTFFYLIYVFFFHNLQFFIKIICTSRVYNIYLAVTPQRNTWVTSSLRIMTRNVRIWAREIEGSLTIPRALARHLFLSALVRAPRHRAPSNYRARSLSVD